jgi:hypothetical protein
LNQSEGEGSLAAPRYVNLMAIAHKNTKAAHALVPPPLSPPGASILRMYEQLARTRPPSESGLAAISYAEITAWERRRRVRLSQWQEETIHFIDDIFRRAHADELAGHGAAPAGEG